MKLKDTLKHYTDTIIYQIIHQSYNSYETTQSRALTEAYFVYPWRQVAGCISLEGISITSFKSVSMRKPGRTRQEVIQLKSPIPLKLGTNVGFGE